MLTIKCIIVYLLGIPFNDACKIRYDLLDRHRCRIDFDRIVGLAQRVEFSVHVIVIALVDICQDLLIVHILPFFNQLLIPSARTFLRRGGQIELELRILPLQPEAPIYLPREADRTPGEAVLKVEMLKS